MYAAVIVLLLFTGCDKVPDKFNCHSVPLSCPNFRTKTTWLTRRAMLFIYHVSYNVLYVSDPLWHVICIEELLVNSSERICHLAFVAKSFPHSRHTCHTQHSAHVFNCIVPCFQKYFMSGILFTCIILYVNCESILYCIFLYYERPIMKLVWLFLIPEGFTFCSCRKVLNMRIFPNERTGRSWDQSVRFLLVAHIALYNRLIT